MITIILDAPMWFEGKLIPAGSELQFTKADYEANKNNFIHHLKEPEIKKKASDDSGTGK